MTPETALSRAHILRRIREFFASRNVLEVETPLLSRGATTDCHIDSFVTQFHPNGWRRSAGSETAFLHASPEFAMKRLLARGLGDIFQICKVFRNGEVGTIHNPEFTMLEWYRKGFGMDALIDETVSLVQECLGDLPVVSRDYAGLLSEYAGIDALAADCATITRFCRSRGLEPPNLTSPTDGLQFVMTEIIEPALDSATITVVSRYPADQAVFAALDPADPRVALRFEIYCGGMELANGFEELGNAGENERRMSAENEKRRAIGKPELPPDRGFIDALHKGLPPCSGVALGIDRLVMLALGKKSIGDVIAFPWEMA
ncbi:MAG: EF-P lysine aminoacylase GenX [Chitinispirillaceae bacterium]|nr:EF-P lysine aminoacylase GenX [Chitinispirillaceae bacterium]